MDRDKQRGDTGTASGQKSGDKASSPVCFPAALNVMWIQCKCPQGFLWSSLIPLWAMREVKISRARAARAARACESQHSRMPKRKITDLSTAWPTRPLSKAPSQNRHSPQRKPYIHFRKRKSVWRFSTGGVPQYGGPQRMLRVEENPPHCQPLEKKLRCLEMLAIPLRSDQN